VNTANCLDLGDVFHASLLDCRAHHYQPIEVRRVPGEGCADDREAWRALPDEGRQSQTAEGGHWKPERVVIIEFPDMDALNAWYTSPEYQPFIALRKGCTSDLDMLITLEGV